MPILEATLSWAASLVLKPWELEVVGITSTAQSEVNTTITRLATIYMVISLSQMMTLTQRQWLVSMQNGRSSQTAGMWTHQTMTTGGVKV
jgi:protein-S-isoprenylcysteine O-methyltransferase Ste14